MASARRCDRRWPGISEVSIQHPSAVARATSSGRGRKSTTAVMTAISYNLAPQQIDAIAAYLSYLR